MARGPNALRSTRRAQASVRAGLTYFHQIGQYALSFKEDTEQRKRHGPIHDKVLLAPLVQEPNLPKDWQDTDGK
ncbi:hypothetical protein [Nitratireductor sp. L15S-10]|uniref:hypothetical protein n=1 Tax=Nitratireductor sp. L15S-10 TaxID=3034028 RepID=UPI003857E293